MPFPIRTPFRDAQFETKLQTALDDQAGSGGGGGGGGAHALLYDAANASTAGYRNTIEPNQTYDLFATVLAVTEYFAPASTITVAASKENDFQRVDATFTIGSGANARFINFNLYSTSGSNAGSNLYGVIGDVHNAGPGTTKAIYGRGVADATCTGTVVGMVSALTFASGSTPANAWAHQFTFLNTATGGNSAIAHFDADVAGNSIPYAILGGSIGNMDISGWFMRWNQRTTATGGFLYFSKSGGTLGFNVDANANVISGAGRAVKTRSVTATGSLVLTDYVVFVDATSGSVTLTLPAANGFGSGVGQVLRIKRTDASANTVTVQRAGSDTVDGGTSTTLAALGGATNNAMDFVANGVSAWGIL